MKKILLISTLLLTSLILSAQGDLKYNVTISKVAPYLHLNGIGARINFYNNDISFVQSSNRLTFDGGTFDLSNNDLVDVDSARITKIGTSYLGSDTIIADTARLTRISATKIQSDTIIADTARVWGLSVHELRVTGGTSIFLDSTATVWDDLMFPVQNLKTVGTTAKPDYDVIGQTLDFPEDTTEAIGFVVQMPHSWKEGSTIYPHVHWLRAAADSVDWRFRYKWFNIGAALPGTWTEKILSHNTQTWTTGTIQELSRSVNGVGLSGAGKTISSILVVKFYRRSDNYTGDAKLLQIDIHYEQDALGSGHETYK